LSRRSIRNHGLISAKTCQALDKPLITAIDWRAAKQKSVTTSSTEAELLSLSYAAKEMIWWRRFFTAIRFHTGEDEAILCDNQQTIRILQKDAPKLVTKLKHVNIIVTGSDKRSKPTTSSLSGYPLLKCPPTALRRPFLSQSTPPSSNSSISSIFRPS
jgi:hypothetical protein